MDWKTIEKISEETGLSAESLRALKKRGIFREKLHWVKAPNGRIFLSYSAIQNWIAGNSKSVNCIRG
jgi:hypothetical protein